MKAIIYFSIGIVLITSFLGCHTTKKTVETKTTPPEVQTGFDAKSVLNKAQANRLTYKTLSVKFAATYQDGDKDMSVSGSFRIAKDSVVWVSVLAPILGFEAVRMLLTPDSVKMLNKLESTYYKGTYAKLSQKFNVDMDFYTLQSILSNAIFQYPRNSQLINDLSASDTAHYCFKSASNNSIVQQLTLTKSNYQFDRTTINDSNLSRNVEISYQNFETINAISFPKQLTINVSNPKAKLIVVLDYTKVEVDKNESFPFTIPSKYSPME